MLETGVHPSLLAFGIPAFAPDPTFAFTQPKDWSRMSPIKKNDVNIHLSIRYRTLSAAHLIVPDSQ